MSSITHMPQLIKQKKKINKGQLNALSGKEWIKLTKSWFCLNYGPRGKKNIHPASFPEQLVERFLSFFTKKGDWILDPFVGSGTTGIVCNILNRKFIGIDSNREYLDLAMKRFKDKTKKNLLFSSETKKHLMKFI